MKEKNIYKIVLLSGALTLIDQFSKIFATDSYKEPLVLTNFLQFSYKENFGIAWSIAIPMPILLILHITLLAAIIWYAIKNINLDKKVSILAVSFVLGGALGNLIDRIVHGFVIDFIAFSFWPVFNLADAFLCIGIFLLALFYGKIKRVS